LRLYNIAHIQNLVKSRLLITRMLQLLSRLSVMKKQTPQISIFFLTTLLKGVFQKYPVEFAYLFGSYAQGSVGPLSDLDIAVYLRYDLSAAKKDEIVGQIRGEVEALLHLPDKIDLVLLNQELPPALERSIVYDGKLLYVKNDSTRVYFEADAICRWLDWQPHHNRLMQEILTS